MKPLFQNHIKGDHRHHLQLAILYSHTATVYTPLDQAGASSNKLIFRCFLGSC